MAAGDVGEGQYDRMAPWYDAFYAGVGKDHSAEARALLAFASRRIGRPVASVLDVACGTGQHLATFGEEVPQVVGTDLSPAMLAVARRRLGPAVPLHRADFRSLALDRTFDVVTCLFSAIGHVSDAEELDAAVARMAAHVAPGGVLLVEPWLTPDRVLDTARRRGGHRSAATVETDAGIVTRVLRSVLDGDVVDLEYAWVSPTPTACTPRATTSACRSSASSATSRPWPQPASHPTGPSRRGWPQVAACSSVTAPDPEPAAGVRRQRAANSRERLRSWTRSTTWAPVNHTSSSTGLRKPSRLVWRTCVPSGCGVSSTRLS